MSDAHSAPKAPQIRQVTVLFLDVVGSTALTRQLDPEDLLDVMDGALKLFATVVDEHGGRVLQYAGDSVLAAFGADRAREDDAERAVRAGLALLAAAREHAAKVQRVHGVAGFDVRVGAHTGQVLLGGGVDEEGTIRGFTVNIAARMEQSAPVGTLRISHDTWRQVRGVFEVQAQPPLQVKGQDEPLATYLVLSARPRAFRVAGRGIGDSETALVGREAELARLLAAFERTAAGGGLQSATLVADAGLGKSRLLHELQHRLDLHAQSCWLVLGRSHPGGTQQPFGLLRDMLAWRLQIADSDGADAARLRLVQGLQPYFAADGEEAALRQAEMLGQLIGLDFSASPRLAGFVHDARLLRDGALAAFATWLQRMAASDGSPVVVLLDDLQWADDASLDALLQLRMRFELPLLLVLAARPALLERRADWGRGWERHETLTLAPLTVSERQTLMRTLLQRVADLPGALLAQIDAQAEGNPYYAEELVLMLIDDGVIDTATDPWRVRPERLVGARIPGTLVGVLQARLDALAAFERRALQAASIVGPVFWDEALSALDADATQSLPALRDKAMVQARPESAFEGTREENFHHHLLHQVTYDTLLKAERRSGHARAASWLAERVGDRATEYLALAADHYQRAGDTVRAIDWLERAARAARDRFANSMALAMHERLLAMPELDGRRRAEILELQTSTADLIGDRVLQARALEAWSSLAESLDDDAMRAGVLASQALHADRVGDLARAEVLAGQAIEVAERCANARAAALACGELGWLLLQRGHVDESEARFRRGLHWARRAAVEMKHPRDDYFVPMLLTMVSTVLLEKNELDAALAGLREALALAQAGRHLRDVCGCHDWLGVVALRLFDLPLAREHTEAMADMARRIGQVVLLAAVPTKHGEIALLEGRFDDAAALAQEGAAAMAKLGLSQHEGCALGVAATALAAAGRHAEARALHQRSHDAYAKPNLEYDMRASRLLIADTWRAEGDLSRARTLVEAEMPALEGSSGLMASTFSLAARMAAWRVLRAAGDERAATQLTLAMTGLDDRVRHIGDPRARERVLTLPPLHREITAAWAAQVKAG